MSRGQRLLVTTLALPAARVVGNAGGVRLFVAVLLAEEVRRGLARTLNALRAAGGPVSWVAPDNLHLTLKFLGELPEPTLEAALDATNRAAQGAARFDLEVAGVSAFPERRPRVVAAGASDRPSTLVGLAASLEDEFAALGVPREDRPFRAHVTLGRVKGPPGARLGAAIAGLARMEFGAQPVSEIALVRSRLTAAGAVYSVVEVFGLAGD